MFSLQSSLKIKGPWFNPTRSSTLDLYQTRPSRTLAACLQVLQLLLEALLLRLGVPQVRGLLRQEALPGLHLGPCSEVESGAGHDGGLRRPGSVAEVELGGSKG